MLRLAAIWLLLAALGCSAGEAPPSSAFEALNRVQNGCIENHGGLRVVHLWGTPQQTLHSMVFRRDPWVFEVALGDVGASRRVRGAPGSPRRYRLQREGVFPAEPR